MLEEQVQAKSASKSSVGFKLQISKEKIEQLHLDQSLKNMDEIIKITQKKLNTKRLIIMFIFYSLSIFIANLLIYKTTEHTNTSVYIYTLFNLIVTFPFLFLLKRDAPLSEADIKKTIKEKFPNQYS